ncbi:MAG: hypothetical protein CL565_00345 [Alphaproteobacteria bacterium]|nr:hypothetical protein [Alphaproteobacteria bacterium]|tara:strand:- start:26 stop:1168 length:1143 start_codon:yes stop_codon:yes gene_type:complete
MDLGVLGKSKTVAPMLVKLYDTHKLYKLAGNKSGEAKSELAGVVSDLLRGDLTEREKDLVGDILVTLVRQAEKDLKMAIAERLSLVKEAPSQLVLELAYEEIEVAKTILFKSQSLDTLDLMYIINSKDAPYWRIIAARENIPGPIVKALSDLDDMPTLINLASNKYIHISESSMEALVKKACNNDELARPLLARKELSRKLAHHLYEHVGEVLKKYIQDNYSFEAPILMPEVNDVLLEFVEEDNKPAINNPREKHSEYLPTEGMLASACRMHERGFLTSISMLEVLKRKQYQSFIAQLSVFCNLSVDQVIDILHQEKGHGLAIIARAYDMDKNSFIQIFLLTENFRDCDRVTETYAFNRAIGYYNRLTQDVAKNLLEELN